MTDRESLMTTLEGVPALLSSIVLEMPEDRRKRRPQPSKWSAHEHFCHLASQEPPMRARLERMLAEEDPELTPLSPSPEEEAGALRDVDFGQAVERFARERAELVGRLRALPPEGWQRTGRHPERSPYTVFILARQLMLHDMLHGFRIEELRFRNDWPEEVPSVAAVVPGIRERLVPGRIGHMGPVDVPGLPPRLVRIYLPQGYDPAKPYNALVLFDGQNAFDDDPSFSGGWYAHEAVERVARRGRPVPVVIGIDHGGDARVQELSPFEFQGKPGQADRLLDWIAGSLLPALAPELNLVPGPVGTVVGGSSMGGLAALYAHFRRPDAFGGALVMSPSFWLADQAIFADVAARPTPEISRIYLDGGEREDRGKLLPLLQRMVEHLVGRGYDSEKLMWLSDPRGTHSEASWRRRLPRALRFFYR